MCIPSGAMGASYLWRQVKSGGSAETPSWGGMAVLYTGSRGAGFLILGRRRSGGRDLGFGTHPDVQVP